MKLAVDVETGKNSRRIWSCDLESEAGGQLEPARGEVEVPGVDLKAWNWPQLGLEPWHGGLTWLGWKCDNNVTILKLRASGVRCCLCAVRANYCRCKAICNNPMCIRECHRHHCQPIRRLVLVSFDQSETHITGNCLEPKLLSRHEMPGLRDPSPQHLGGCNKNKADHNICETRLYWYLIILWVR